VALPGLWAGPIVWGQATVANTSALSLLAWRRWCSSLTLSSSEAVPSLYGLWSWLLGLLALLALVLWVQGPVRALRQTFDLAGHARLVATAFDRLRRAGRMVAVTIGATVVAWTASQTFTFNDPRGRDDLLLLTKARSLGELAVEQGVMAALTPLRDVFGLGDNLPLLLLATVVLFRALTERPERPRFVSHGGRGGATRPMSRWWSNMTWGATGLYFLYRLAARVSGMGDLPMGGCLVFEAVLIPILMMLSDGVLLAWILVELRSVSLGDTGNDTLDPLELVGLLPGAVLACLLAMPGRYVVTGVLLFSAYLPNTAVTTAVGSLLRWQLNRGLADIQGAALVTLGLAGAVAWSRGTPDGALRGYFRMVAAEGGHLLALVALAGLAAGAASALAYLLVLALPASTWVLAAADGYAHYATLPVGLLTVAALVELGERALPAATLTAADLPGRKAPAGVDEEDAA
jgi:hypothetical protein